MDVLIVLAVFAGLVWALWALGAHGLAVILGGCAVVTAIVEVVWTLGVKQSVSQEVGKLKQWKALTVIILIQAGAIGLGLHLWAMR